MKPGLRDFAGVGVLTLVLVALVAAIVLAALGQA